jgi:predicted permease
MLISMIILVVAIALLCVGLRLSDDVMRLLLTSVGRFCLLLSMVYAPLLIKLVIVIGILMIPVCAQRYNLRHSHCSRLCLARIHCAHASH